MSDNVHNDPLLFLVEWFDPLPQLKKKYILKYYMDNHMIEMIDIKTKKLFLKKSVCPPELSKEDFYVGAKIILYSRELEIIDYGDNKTRQKLQHQTQYITIIIPYQLYTSWGKLLDIVHYHFTIMKLKTIILSSNLIENIENVLQISNRQTNMYHDGIHIVFYGYAEDGYNVINELMRKVNEKMSETDSILYTTNGQQTNDLNELLFSNKIASSTATLDSATCAVIKPHAVKSKLIGRIIDDIICQGYDISAIKSVSFDKAQAEEFLEVYKGVVPEYSDMVVQLSNGLSIAMEIRAENAVQTFRWTAGPWDTSMAKELYPQSLRGKYGIDNIKNAIHCTDLPSDAMLECEYVFNIMDYC